MKKILLTILVFILLVLITPLIMLAMEDQILKNELNNCYINQNYSGWQTVSVERIGQFKIPGHWIVEEQADDYLIKNQDGNIIAFGTVLGDITSKHDGIKSFIEHIVDDSIDSLQYQYDNTFSNVHGSTFFSFVATQQLNSNKYHCIKLENTLIHLEYSTIEFVLIIKDGVEPYEDLFSIAEAIVYSYTMGGERHPKTD